MASPEGFTLLEMVVSFGIFSVVIITSVGAVLGLNDAQIKAANIQAIQDNLRFALESMTKEMRTATAFAPAGGAAPSYRELSFTRSDGARIGYCLRDNALKKFTGVGSCETASAVTSDEIVVEELIFYVIGSSAGPSDGQPRVSVALRARSRDPKLATTFRTQTTVTPRERDR